MITFRFYLVTLVAIFLAVALGVTIGSTFLEPALVQDLNNQVESVRDNLDERVARIDELNGNIDDLEAYVEESAPYAVDHRLDGATVLVAATEGTDQGNVERLVARIRQAGGTTPGIVWIQPSFGSDDDSAEVLAALGVDAGEASGDAVADAWATVLDAGTPVPAEGSTTTTTVEPPTSETTATTDTSDTSDTTDTTGASTTLPPTTTTTTPPTIPPLFESGALQVLDDAGWVRLQEIEVGEALGDPDPAAPPRFATVLVSQADVDDAADLTTFARQHAAGGVPTLVGESWIDPGDEGPERGTTLTTIREDAELSTLVSTVDDIELVQGQVAVVLAVADLGAGVVGHYGYGPGAELVIPPWSGP
jgi:hypothetical protein